MSDIPLLDLQFQADCPEAETAIAGQIASACARTGFFAHQRTQHSEQHD